MICGAGRAGAGGAGHRLAGGAGGHVAEVGLQLRGRAGHQLRADRARSCDRPAPRRRGPASIRRRPCAAVHRRRRGPLRPRHPSGWRRRHTRRKRSKPERREPDHARSTISSVPSWTGGSRGAGGAKRRLGAQKPTVKATNARSRLVVPWAQSRTSLSENGRVAANERVASDRSLSRTELDRLQMRSTTGAPKRQRRTCVGGPADVSFVKIQMPRLTKIQNESACHIRN